MKKSEIVLILLLLAGCTSSPVVINDPEFSDHSSIDFENLRFRRPETPLYDREVPMKPVEASKAVGKFDCERSEEFFSKLNLSAIRSCLNQAAPPPRGGEAKTFELQWSLKKEGQPTLVLRDPEEAPECFRQTLAEIPFPRELVFVVPSETPAKGECFTSRLALEGGDLLGWEVPRSKVRLRVRFPLRENLKTDREVERMLRTWTLSIYRGGSREEDAFHGRFLPVRYCLKCLGIPEDQERGAASVPPPVSLWPSRGTDESVRWESDSNQ